MFFRIATAFALIAALGATLPAAAQTPDDRPGIAVFPFENGGSFTSDPMDLEALRIGVQQMLLTELAQNGALRIVERGKIQEILNEQDLGASGRVDPRTAARIGKIVGARYMVLGSFVDTDEGFRLDGRIIDAETSETLKAVGVIGKRKKIYSLTTDLAGRITKDLNLPPLPKEVQEARKGRVEPDDEAVVLYSKALTSQGRGRTDEAIQYLEKAIARFPDYTEAVMALKQLRRG